MDIENKYELQTHQGMDSRNMQKVNFSGKYSIGRTPYSVQNIVIDDIRTCNVNKVNMYMILVMRSIYF